MSVKPTTPTPSETNALITTKTGREVALHLVSSGSAKQSWTSGLYPRIRPPRSFSIEAVGSSVIVSQTESIAPRQPLARHSESAPIPANLTVLKQQSLRKPHWLGKQLRVAVGSITESDQQMVVAFSF